MNNLKAPPTTVNVTRRQKSFVGEYVFLLELDHEGSSLEDVIEFVDST